MSELFSQAEVERFWRKVDKSGLGGCWIWTACVDGRSYGSYSAAGKRRRAHRVAYELTKGAPPAGLILDHLCRVKTCVNPDHLEAVPQRVNVLRGDSHIARQAQQTHCKHGHEFTPENTRYATPGSYSSSAPVPPVHPRMAPVPCRGDGWGGAGATRHDPVRRRGNDATVSDRCGVRWGDHHCRFDNDGHLVGVDCECHCDQADAGYPYLGAGHTDFAALTPPSLAYAAQRNYEHAIRFGVGA